MTETIDLYVMWFTNLPKDGLVSLTFKLLIKF